VEARSLEYNKEIQMSIEFSMGILAKTIKYLKERNVKVAVTGVPHKPQFTGEHSAKPE